MKSNSPFKKISLERTACYGDCPIYKLFISSKGNVHLTQRSLFGFEKKMRKWKIDQGRIDKLNEIIYKYGYFGIKKKEPNDFATDMPFCITKIELEDGSKREIEHYLGDNEYPKRLTTIENWIDKIANVNMYFKIYLNEIQLGIFDKYHHWNEASSYDHGIYDIRRCCNRSPKSQAQDSLVQAENLFNSLLQRAFLPADRYGSGEFVN